MRDTIWWYLGGAIVTLVVGIALGELWSLNVGSGAIGWGAVIGSSIRDARLKKQRGEPPKKLPQWVNLAITVLISTMLLSAMIFVTLALDALMGRSGEVTEPLYTAIALAVLSVAIAAVIFARGRRLGRMRATSAEDDTPPAENEQLPSSS
ncbi:hypothetical protein [Marisediminicola senii]|uniref:hypothetical protein n=1 Tax=Marisediminicola senii TaxID=2711233 RepID=UPI0013EB4D94|nr:hypothetical protein [Marisediminicola senii]